jgi:hypothetical protein
VVSGSAKSIAPAEDEPGPPPIQGKVGAPDLNRNHEQGNREMNRIYFRQAIPKELPIFVPTKAYRENIRIVVGEDEATEDKEKRNSDYAGIEQQVVLRHLIDTRDHSNVRKKNQKGGVKTYSR